MRSGVGLFRDQLISDLDALAALPPMRPRPVTLLPGVDEHLAAHYRADAQRILTTMSPLWHEHPVLSWLRQLAATLSSRLRVALS